MHAVWDPSVNYDVRLQAAHNIVMLRYDSLRLPQVQVPNCLCSCHPEQAHRTMTACDPYKLETRLPQSTKWHAYSNTLSAQVVCSPVPELVGVLHGQVDADVSKTQAECETLMGTNTPVQIHWMNGSCLIAVLYELCALPASLCRLRARHPLIAAPGRADPRHVNHRLRSPLLLVAT